MEFELDAYFKRIGYTAKPSVSLETLNQLHRLHTLAIPFENLTPFTHQEVKLDDASLSQKFIKELRGGYCFEQNLLFKKVLETLGFKVTGLAGRVLWNQPEDLIPRRSHMLLKVDLKGEEYLADVGFGGLTLTMPIKFKTDIVQKTTHEDFRIMPLEKDFKLQANVAGEWKTVYRFDFQEQYFIDYEVANFYLYTHPDSIFRNLLIVARPFENGRYALSGTQFSTYWKDGRIEKVQLNTMGEIKDVLRKTFGIRLPEYPSLDTRFQTLFI